MRKLYIFKLTTSSNIFLYATEAQMLGNTFSRHTILHSVGCGSHDDTTVRIVVPMIVPQCELWFQ